MIIGTITNWSEVQGQINDAPNVLAGTISSAELMGGQVVGMRGLKGDKGDTGDTGADGQDGADGFSPIANVSKVGDTATITITDKDGTTTANVSDGQNGAFVVHFVQGVYQYFSDKTAEEIYDAHADGLDVIGILELNDGFHVLALSLAHMENTNPVCKFSVIESPYTSDNVHIDFVELTVDNNGVTDSGSYTKYVPPTTRKINNKNLASDITLTASDVGAQETLVSGTNIKTINNVSLLGSGNISVGGGGGSSAFIAEYGVTTYADVKDAYDEDATIICTVDDSGNTVICQLAYYDDENGGFYFSQPQSDGAYWAGILIDDTWVDGYFQFASTDTATQLRDGLMDALDKQKLDGIASGAEVNVQSDWNEADSSDDAYIKNKPTLFSGDYDDLTNKPTIPADNLYVADKSDMTYADVTQALADGKSVIMFDGTIMYPFQLVSSDLYWFARPYGSVGFQRWSLASDDTWTDEGAKSLTNASNITSGTLGSARLPTLLKVVSQTSSATSLNYGMGKTITMTLTAQSGYDLVGIVGVGTNHAYASSIGGFSVTSSANRTVSVDVTNRNTSASGNFTDLTITVQALWAISNIY